MAEVRVSVPPAGVVTTFSCLTVTSPVGNKPLLASVARFKSDGSNVTLVPVDFLVKIWVPIVKVTVAPGVTFVTTIERFGKPPFSVTESVAISGACGFTFTVTGTFCLTLTPVESAGSSTSTCLVKVPTVVSDGAPSTHL